MHDPKLSSRCRCVETDSIDTKNTDPVLVKCSLPLCLVTDILCDNCGQPLAHTDAGSHPYLPAGCTSKAHAPAEAVAAALLPSASVPLHCCCAHTDHAQFAIIAIGMTYLLIAGAVLAGGEVHPNCHTVTGRAFTPPPGPQRHMREPSEFKMRLANTACVA